MTLTRPMTNQTRIYRDLKRRLESGQYAPDSQLPSIRELARSYNSSKGVLQIVINRLQHENLIVARHGRGLFVCRPPKFRRILLLNPTTGHEWSDYTNAFVQSFGRQDNIALLVESADAREAQGLITKIESLLAENLDTIIFNGLPDFQLDFMNQFVNKTNLLCFYSDLMIQPTDASIGRVVSDWHSGGRVGMEHLLDIGCRHVAVISHQPHPVHAAAATHAGIREAIKNHHGKVKLSRFVGQHQDPDYGQQFAAFLDEHPDVDGLFAESDVRAARLMPVLRRLGRRVPDDVAVLGYYNTPWANAADPPMSSICTRPQQLVDRAVRMLLEHHHDDHEVVAQHLEVRASTMR